MFFKRKSNNSEVWIVAGLGNYGPEYESTRHNCGFLAVDKLSEKLGIAVDKRKFKAYIGEGKIESGGKSVKIVLMKPLTYMNNSGEAIEEAMNWYKTDESHLIVIYDDIDLAPGAIRIRPKGSAGSHNGMKSVLSHTDSDVFPRIRVGIGSKPQQMDLAAYVLGHFSKEELTVLGNAFKAAADAVVCIIDEGTEKAMGKFNGKKF
ncbi:MAG: aminoacyl-tRNA hydrolase [Clostridia bacterium]|nr:aminoacyl-tRNA hydrolase [Clostridia bacterium]